ncbi:MAG: carboxynorspermidine decarboxylase, partial [Muribaculaceae bacterium]|nr:carboxynorspermidine decarboxylase [Muribaculaceae bacterium]
DWWFQARLGAGKRLTIEDMNHYTTVKTTMFNGIHHPSIALVDLDGNWKYLRRYSYEDYKSRMS